MQLKEKRVYPGLWFQRDRAHHSREGMADQQQDQEAGWPHFQQHTESSKGEQEGYKPSKLSQI